MPVMQAGRLRMKLEGEGDEERLTGWMCDHASLRFAAIDNPAPLEARLLRAFVLRPICREAERRPPGGSVNGVLRAMDCASAGDRRWSSLRAPEWGLQSP
jgi:hypothetical protein